MTYNYQAGSFGDNIVEAYSGPHDFLNSQYFYDVMGNNIPTNQLPSLIRHLSSFLNGMDVVLATPAAAGVLYSNYGKLDPSTFH